MLNGTIESTLAKYLEFRVFELFRNSLIREIEPHCREGSKLDIYKHLFLCPSQVSKRRNFKLTGVLSPFVCMWRSSPLEWNETLYGRSVLPRDFRYTGTDGEMKSETGFLYDLKFTMDIFSSSYYRSFRDRVNQDLIDLDRLRYFNIDVKELLKDCAGCTTKIELMLNGQKSVDNVESGDDNRSFDLSAQYTVSMTVPYCRSFEYIDAVNVYLNENKVWSYPSDESSEG